LFYDRSYALKGEVLPIPLLAEAKTLSKGGPSFIDKFRNSLETAKSYAEVWRIVKGTVEFSLGKRRGSMMLFLDDLPLQLGAYHPIGTNNIVLNRALVEIVEASISSKRVVNALVYNLLLHEYLHALGEYSESEVRRMVIAVARKCFGEEHTATVIAKKTPWVLLGNIPLEAVNAPKRVMQIVRDFEKADMYIV
jgi:hypothetical protein